LSKHHADPHTGFMPSMPARLKSKSVTHSAIERGYGLLKPDAAKTLATIPPSPPSHPALNHWRAEAFLPADLPAGASAEAGALAEAGAKAGQLTHHQPSKDRLDRRLPFKKR
jgi:hypothetical protein